MSISVRAKVLTTLEEGQLQLAARDLTFAHELLRILDRFQADGIDATPFKGPVLNAALYGRRAVRNYSDLDILVRPDDVRTALTVLRDLGYTAQFELTDPTRSAVVRFIRELICQNAIGMVVELHWHFAPVPYPCPMAPEDIWARRTSVQLDNRDVPSLGKEDLVLYLCFHGWKHCWTSRAWVEDVARLLEITSNFDWEWIRGQARHTHTSRILLLGLALAEEVLNARVPESLIVEAEATPAVQEMKVAAVKWLQGNSECGPTSSERAGFLMRGIEGWHRRLLFGVAMALRPTPAEWYALQLPDRVGFLYYPYRLWRLVTGQTSLNG